ncbi:MAG: hypothetical protein ACOC8E_04355 [Planctomycetota bacterium]
MSIRLAACMLAVVCLVGTGFAQEITTLSIKEQVGVARTDEPVRMGIPLPKGLVKNADELALTDAKGNPIPCQFRTVARWLDDDSVRWVHAVFKASVPANGEVEVKLVKGKAAGSEQVVKVEKTDDGVMIDNGVLKLVVGGKTLIRSARLGDTAVIKPHENGGLVATLDGKEYRQSDDSTVTVVERGSEGAVVQVEGRLAHGDDRPFVYKTYVHVFTGSPEVRLDVTYWNASGNKPADHVPMSDLSVALPTELDRHAGTGGEGKLYRGDRAAIVAKHSDQCDISIDGKPAGKAAGKSKKPFDVGWAAVGSDGTGLAGGVRWFWQMHPKAVEAGDDGTLRFGLYAREVGKPLDVYMGQGRTHYITLRFGSGDKWAGSLLEYFSGRQMPLRAVCTPEYYCRTAQAFGPVADADPALFPDDLKPLAKKYDGILKESAQNIEKKIDGHTYRGVTRDSYGYYPWGDVFHWANTRGVENKWNILWESNYYDYPWAALLQFARTGELLYLDICDRHGLHLGDVFMCKWHPQERLRGACRYSPPANHVGLDRNYKNPKPYVSVEFNHHKALSILTRYLLLGDPVARDHFLLALNNATLNPEHSWRQCRGPGAKLWTLTEGYRLTEQPATMKMMKRCVQAGARQRKRGGSSFGHKRGQFMYGHATEGLIRYIWLTGDEDPMETIQVMNDWLIEADKVKKATGNSAMSMAWLWRKTGEEKYREAAVRLIKWLRPEHRPKGFGQQFRSAPYAWYYLSKLSADD